MTVRITLSKVCLLALLFISSSLAVAASNGSIKGTIKDSQTKEALPFANVTLKGTSLGTATDISGVYTISNVPPGMYKVRFGLIGYKTKELTVTVAEGKPSQLNVNMEPASIEGDVVIVTAQAQGQNQAINEQLTSATIKSVVSAAKIQELPDANAAESVGRLPGVSLMREGGEGSKVVIRGLSPQYNQITIDGVELASNVQSGNNIVSTDAGRQDATGNIMGDRGTNLSMVSSSMLGGIEVIKAITPDMDAAVLGGVVNFGMRKAIKSTEGGLIPAFELLGQGGYNQLKNTRNDYKLVGSAEQRFAENSFGVFLQGSFENRNLSANQLGADFNLEDKDHGDAGTPLLNNLNLTDVFRKRERVGATLVLDYKHEDGEIGFMNFLSNSTTDATSRRQTAQVPSPNEQLLYGLTQSQTKLQVISNLLSVKQAVSFFQVAVKLSHSYSQSENPGDVTFNFLQQKAGLDKSMQNLSPQELGTKIKADAPNAYLYNIQNSNSASKERSYTGSLDLTSDFAFTDNLTGKLKFGGFYQYRNRSYDYNQNDGSTIYDGGDAIISDFRKLYPWLTTNTGGLSLQNFVYDGYDYGNFLNGDYTMAYPLNADLMMNLLPIANANASTTKIGGAYKSSGLASKANDYSGHEVKSAGYVMATINLGEEFSLLPGVRYQNLTTTYTAVRGENTSNGFNGNEVTLEKSHGYFLPMVHFSYKPSNWLQFHLAYTNTLNYPDYSSITPRYFIGSSFISYNNVDLKPAQSENLDAVVSVYNNEIGLLTVNGFSKRVTDLIFYAHEYRSDFSAYPELSQLTAKGQLYDFTTYINSSYAVTVQGVEADWQTHFWYLPEPFSGIVFNINYTHIFSEATYPKSIKVFIPSETGDADINYVTDTSYVTRLLNQPNDILNTSMGFDYRGFSSRVSMLYQDNIFKRPDFWMQNRVISDKYVRWDLSVKQELPWFGMQVYLNLNNLTGANEVDLNQKNSFPASEERYGMSADLGIRIKM